MNNEHWTGSLEIDGLFTSRSMAYIWSLMCWLFLKCLKYHLRHICNNIHFTKMYISLQLIVQDHSLADGPIRCALLFMHLKLHYTNGNRRKPKFNSSPAENRVRGGPNYRIKSIILSTLSSRPPTISRIRVKVQPPSPLGPGINIHNSNRKPYILHRAKTPCL